MRKRQNARPFTGTPDQHRAKAKAKATERQAARDAAYRQALGVPEGAPLPNTIGKAESMGRPPFVHRGVGERHALNPVRDWEMLA